MSRHTRKRRGAFTGNDPGSPMNSVANVFDVAMVFSVALLVALVISFNIAELLTDSDVTIVKNPGQPNMQIIQKMNDTIEIFEISSEDQIGGGIGDVLGTAYRLEDGRVIYVPENGSLDFSNSTEN